VRLVEEMHDKILCSLDILSSCGSKTVIRCIIECPPWRSRASNRAGDKGAFQKIVFGFPRRSITCEVLWPGTGRPLWGGEFFW